MDVVLIVVEETCLERIRLKYHSLWEPTHAELAVTIMVTPGTEIYELQNGIATEELPVMHLNKLSCVQSANTTEAIAPAAMTPDKNFMINLDLDCFRELN